MRCVGVIRNVGGREEVGKSKGKITGGVEWAVQIAKKKNSRERAMRR